MLSLLSTLASVTGQVDLLAGETIIYTLFGFCLLGTNMETLYANDQNAFINTFFEQEEELMDGISIRAAVWDLFEDLFSQLPAFQSH